MRRSELKALVREIMVEVLSEGLGRESLSEAVRQAPPKNHLAESASRVKVAPRSPRTSVPSRAEAVTHAVSSLTSDPVMAQILADTAITTLPAQAAHDRPGSLSSIANVSDPGINVDVLFEGGSSKWADIAFSSTKPRVG